MAADWMIRSASETILYVCLCGECVYMDQKLGWSSTDRHYQGYFHILDHPSLPFFSPAVLCLSWAFLLFFPLLYFLPFGCSSNVLSYQCDHIWERMIWNFTLCVIDVSLGLELSQEAWNGVRNWFLHPKNVSTELTSSLLQLLSTPTVEGISFLSQVCG